MRKNKCPNCLGLTGFVSAKDYCDFHAQEKLTGKIGIIDAPVAKVIGRSEQQVEDESNR